MKKAVVLGGYGNFGKRICENLADMENLHLYIVGRDLNKAQALADELENSAKATLIAVGMDVFAADFTAKLAAIAPDVVIHSCGPFQGQNYHVPEACIALGAHYIDLADSRDFVCNIAQLDEAAKLQNVIVVSGASSVPGLSSAVVSHYQTLFQQIESIDVAIAPGNKAERGAATVAGILSYTGHPFPVFRQGNWQRAFGWMDIKKHDFKGKLCRRWLANVEVPDLELFPAYYKVKKRVSFQAGLELTVLHLSLYAMAVLARLGLVKDWSVLTKSTMKISHLFDRFGSADGGMNVRIKGVLKSQSERANPLFHTTMGHMTKGEAVKRQADNTDKARTELIDWSLFAANGNGPYIPTLASIILARKLLTEDTPYLTKISQDSDRVYSGALPCVGLINLEDFYPYFDAWSIKYSVIQHAVDSSA